MEKQTDLQLIKCLSPKRNICLEKEEYCNEEKKLYAKENSFCIMLFIEQGSNRIESNFETYQLLFLCEP